VGIRAFGALPRRWYALSANCPAFRPQLADGRGGPFALVRFRRRQVCAQRVELRIRQFSQFLSGYVSMLLSKSSLYVLKLRMDLDRRVL
jgi:hypothetical protein